MTQIIKDFRPLYERLRREVQPTGKLSKGATALTKEMDEFQKILSILDGKIPYQIAFIGESGTGKSTLINSILGLDLLATGSSTAITNVTTKIFLINHAGSYAKIVFGALPFSFNETRFVNELHLGTIREDVKVAKMGEQTVLTVQLRSNNHFTRVRELTKKHSAIPSVHIDAIEQFEYHVKPESQFNLPSNVCLVDVPGRHIGEAGHTDQYQKGIQKADALVFVAKCERLDTDTKAYQTHVEDQLLKDTKKFFVITRWDEYKPNELPKIIENLAKIKIDFNDGQQVFRTCPVICDTWLKTQKRVLLEDHEYQRHQARVATMKNLLRLEAATDDLASSGIPNFITALSNFVEKDLAQRETLKLNYLIKSIKEILLNIYHYEDADTAGLELEAKDKLEKLRDNMIDLVDDLYKQVSDEKALKQLLTVAFARIETQLLNRLMQPNEHGILEKAMLDGIQKTVKEDPFNKTHRTRVQSIYAPYVLGSLALDCWGKVSKETENIGIFLRAYFEREVQVFIQRMQHYLNPFAALPSVEVTILKLLSDDKQPDNLKMKLEILQTALMGAFKYLPLKSAFAETSAIADNERILQIFEPLSKSYLEKQHVIPTNERENLAKAIVAQIGNAFTSCIEQDMPAIFKLYVNLNLRKWLKNQINIDCDNLQFKIQVEPRLRNLLLGDRDNSDNKVITVFINQIFKDPTHV